jgi:hypothetical protein
MDRRIRSPPEKARIRRSGAVGRRETIAQEVSREAAPARNRGAVETRVRSGTRPGTEGNSQHGPVGSWPLISLARSCSFLLRMLLRTMDRSLF